MPSRRDLIRMTPAEVAAYLAAQRRIVIVTNGPGGMPHAVPMNYGIDDAGRVVISSFAKSQKVRNLERDPRATLLVESGESYGDLKSVMLYCDVEILRDPQDVGEGMRRVQATQQLAGSLGEAASAQVRASIAKRVILRCTPFRTVSWDHAKLAGSY